MPSFFFFALPGSNYNTNQKQNSAAELAGTPDSTEEEKGQSGAKKICPYWCRIELYLLNIAGAEPNFTS